MENHCLFKNPGEISNRVKKYNWFLKLFLTLPILYMPFIQARAEQDKSQGLCRFEEGPCVKKMNAREFILETSPAPPQAFKETTFTLSIRGAEIKSEEIILDLSMPGMYMGKNQVRLKKSGRNTYTGKGIIPRCPSGKTLWQVGLTLPDGTKIDFRFHVKY